GKLQVRLKDLTGHYSRCDVIVLTSDLDYRPPAELEKLQAERIARGGLSREVKQLGPYDTVVVGGGLAGCFAAVASARHGCRTVLVQNRPVLGGNASEEILVDPQGDTTREPLDPGEGGLIEEVHGPVRDYSKRLLQLVQAEPNLHLLLNTHATGVELARPGQIAAVLALDTTTNQRLRITGKIFIDCTGDGSIGAWAGAEYRHGREPRSMYNETRAPEQGDTRTMGGTLRYASELRPQPVPFQAPAWAYRFERCEDFGIHRHPQIHFGGWQWIIEYGGMKNTIHDAEHIRDELLRIIWGMWDHVKNHCPKLKKEAENYELIWVSHVVGKRESRRLLGDYIMTEHDIAQQVLFADRVAYGGWGIDLHPPGGFWDKLPPAEFSHKTKFSIPFRSLYSKDIENLMMAGRCISVTHAALGATRVMITCGLQGQAVGTAAAVCKKYQTLPRQIAQNYITELQQMLLKDGCYIIDLPNQDPRDLALRAKATASSTAPGQLLEKLLAKAASPQVHPLNCPRAVLFRVTANRIHSVSLYLHSENPKPTRLTLGLRPAKALDDFTAEKDLAQATAEVPPQSASWVSFLFDRPVQPGYYYVWLGPQKGIGWALFDQPRQEATRAYHNGKEWIRMPETYTFRLDPPSEAYAQTPEKPRSVEDAFAPSNVNNGFARAIRGWPNAWRPDPMQPMPQWVALDFGQPVEFNTVHVSFQTKQMRAEDFRLEAFDGQQWQTLVTVQGNKDRRRVIRFDRIKASQLRLVILKATDGMAVCEIRVYDEP
ncbi:MAG: FAD-dependent oxidoreductase, partial [Thermoguttaceae bacterium]|nr:FAD-dependent oxidoreductase [Thermoguttaceae bacterium]